MERRPLVKLEYKTEKDGMLYPNIRISENGHYDQRHPGMFGRGWKEFMREKYPRRLLELIAQGRINEMIAEVDKEAETKKEALIQKLLEAQPMPETEDTLKRAGHMGMITAQAEEMILQEVAYRLR